MRHTPRTLVVVAALVAALVASLCLRPTAEATPAITASPVVEPVETRLSGRQVLAISVDGLNVSALRRLGRQRTPHLHRLLRRGARTLNARTQVEMTVTLPNHTSMLTGRRIDAGHGGHGVDWNTDRRRMTVHRAAHERVASIFTVVHRAGGSTALFATESKFSLFRRSWPRAIDRTTIVQDGDAAVTRAVRRDLVRHDRAFTFLHLGAPDEAGHEHRFLSPAYLRAVARIDRMIGSLLRTIRDHRSLHDVELVLTADHGGVPGSTHHDDPSRFANYRVPFVIWGPGVDHGDLHAMSPRYADPRRSRPGFRGVQPVRNGDLANLSADLLGLPPVPGSRWDADQRLSWRR